MVEHLLPLKIEQYGAISWTRSYIRCGFDQALRGRLEGLPNDKQAEEAA
jgi:hypothetical protein